MAVQPTSRDHRRDLLVAAVDERIAELRSVARTARHPLAPGRRGPVARLRDALGGQLIAIGSALVVDDPPRRRPALRP